MKAIDGKKRFISIEKKMLVVFTNEINMYKYNRKLYPIIKLPFLKYYSIRYKYKEDIGSNNVKKETIG